MPLYKTIHQQPNTGIFIWKIEESLQELAQNLQLSSESQARLATLKSEVHQRQFLSVRKLLQDKGYCDTDIAYAPSGKPFLKDGRQLSITHSHDFVGLILSDRIVGIDIEKKRDKIMRIANKFTPLNEYKTLANDEAIIRKLTIVWSAKEAIYKANNTPGLSFLNDIYVEDFDFEAQKTQATVSYDERQKAYQVNFLEFDGFSCVYVLSSATA